MASQVGSQMREIPLNSFMNPNVNPVGSKAALAFVTLSVKPNVNPVEYEGCNLRLLAAASLCNWFLTRWPYLRYILVPGLYYRFTCIHIWSAPSRTRILSQRMRAACCLLSWGRCVLNAQPCNHNHNGSGKKKRLYQPSGHMYFTSLCITGGWCDLYIYQISQ